MSTETDPLARLGRDHAQLVARFTAARLPARVARRTRWRALRKTTALLASAVAGTLATVIATGALVEHATKDASTLWATVTALSVALGALAAFVLLLARDAE